MLISAIAEVAYFHGQSEAQLTIRRDDGIEQAVPLSHFFREPTEFSTIEQAALQHCRGSVLDVGAGNGMVGDELRHRGVSKVVGVDIIKEAKQATLRDRSGVYDDYRVADLTNIPKTDEDALLKHDLNCMTTVAALGYGDIPPLAFLQALDLISTPAWLAFNIKEDFLHERDQSGFSRLIRQLIQEDYILPLCYRRYRHRLSVTGEPLYYVAMIAKKCKPVASHLFSDYA